MLGKIMLALTGLLAMSAPIVQGTEVNGNIVHGNVHDQGFAAPARDLTLARRGLLTDFGATFVES